MIYTSNLPCDQDMIRALGSIAIPVNLFTDACFASVDEKLVCVERKKLGDLCQCISDGRFLFQMQNCKSAGADYLCLVLEGRYRRSSEDGLLEIPVWGVNSRGNHAEIWKPVQPTMQFSRFCSYLFELSYLTGIFVFYSENVKGTVDIIQCLYSWFQRFDHSSLETIFKRPAPSVQLVRPSLVRRIASELTSIGWERSGAVAQRFSSVSEMVNASVQDWESITTTDSEGKSRKIGHKIAEKVVKSLGGQG